MKALPWLPQLRWPSFDDGITFAYVAGRLPDCHRTTPARLSTIFSHLGHWRLQVRLARAHSERAFTQVSYPEYCPAEDRPSLPGSARIRIRLTYRLGAARIASIPPQYRDRRSGFAPRPLHRTQRSCRLRFCPCSRRKRSPKSLLRLERS